MQIIINVKIAIHDLESKISFHRTGKEEDDGNDLVDGRNAATTRAAVDTDVEK